MWFRVRILLEVVGRGHVTPSVNIRLVSRLPEDPSFEGYRISLVLERELILGLQREIMRAIEGRTLVRFMSSAAMNNHII